MNAITPHRDPILTTRETLMAAGMLSLVVHNVLQGDWFDLVVVLATAVPLLASVRREDP